ncbi:MAG: hypothetical protein K8I82_23490 [Anaerolineae bacterium]|nr:hypothetical protein [Anaerolineae bacterium]
MSFPGMSKNRLLTFYQAVGGVILAIIVIVGIYRVEAGIQNLFDGRGEDRVLAGDEVGELMILSTRHLVVRTSAVQDVVVGLALMIGSVTLYKFFERRLVRYWLH